MLAKQTASRQAGAGLILLSFAALALVIYLPCLDGDFIADDYLHIAGPGEAPELFACWLEPFFRVPGSGEAQYYRPLTLFAYGAVTRLLGPNPVPFHLLNICLHSLNAWLLALIAIGRLGSRRGGAAVGLIFLLHPLQVEEVAYISGLGGLGACACCLGAIWAWSNRPGRQVLPAALMAVGLLWKESPLILPVLLSLAPEAGERSRRERITPLVLLWAVAAAYLLGREIFLPQLSLLRPETSPLLPRLGASSAGLVTTLRLLFFPTGLHFYRTIPVGWSTLSWLGALAGGALLVAAISGRRKPGIGLGIFWFLAAMLPFSGLRPLYLQRDAVFWGEHFSYFALGGGGLAAAGTLRFLLDRKGWRRTLPPATAAIAACLGLLTLQQASLWSSETAVARSAVRGEPDLFRVRGFLAEALDREGRCLEAAAQYGLARRLLARHADGIAEEEYAPFAAAHLRLYLIGSGLNLGRAGDLLGAALAGAELMRLFPDDPAGNFLLERARAGGLKLPPAGQGGTGPAWELLRGKMRQEPGGR